MTKDATGFVIEEGVPVPKGNPRRKWPLVNMEIGQSFEFPYKFMRQISHCAANLKYYGGKTFVCRKVNDTTGRCWRVS